MLFGSLQITLSAALAWLITAERDAVLRPGGLPLASDMK